MNREISGSDGRTSAVRRQPAVRDRHQGRRAGVPDAVRRAAVVTENTVRHGSSYERRLRGGVTPMRADLSIDGHAFAEHCRRLLDDGCHGLGDLRHHRRGELALGRRARRGWKLVADGIPAGRLLPGTGACALPDAVSSRGMRWRWARQESSRCRPSTTRASPTTGCSASSPSHRARRRRPPAGVPLPHPAEALRGLLARADRAAARRLPGHRRRYQGQRGRRGAHRAHLQGVPAADRVRGHRGVPAGHAALGRRRVHLRHLNVTAPRSHAPSTTGTRPARTPTRSRPS